MFITCGEALFDIFASSVPSTSPHGINFAGVIGGSPLNVALGLSRMGNRASLFTRLSTDMFGDHIRNFMGEMNIGSDYCVKTDKQTTLSVILTGHDGQPDYSLYTKGTADCSMEMSDIPQKLDPRDRVLHLGSFAAALPESGAVLRAFAKREAKNCFIAFDPNVRSNVIPERIIWQAMIDEILPVANFIKVSDEDLAFINPALPLGKFIDCGLEAGADIVCVTRGARGVIAGNAGGERIEVAGLKVNVVDTVGAGDTFQAASLHYLAARGLTEKGKAQKADLEELIIFASHAAALTCTRRGANLPTLAEINTFSNLHFVS